MRPILLAATTDAFARRLYEAVPEPMRAEVRMWPEPVTDRAGVESAMRSNPKVIVIGPGLIDEVTARIAATVRSDRPDIQVVVVAQGASPLPDHGIPGSIRGSLTASSDAEAIRTAVERAVAAAGRAAASDVASPPTKTVTGGARVTTVISPKGGAGKTVLSTNLAAGLAATAPRRVVIVDLDLQFGDVAYALGLRPRHTMYDALGASGGLDATTLKVFLTHHRSELYALCAPDDPARGEMIGVESVEHTIKLLASEFDHVVVDTGAGLTEQVLATLDLSTDLVLLADMDVPSVRHLSKVVRALDRLRMTDQTRHIVLNRADARVGLSMPDVAAAAGLDVEIEIPVSKQVPVTLNEGNPILLSNPRSPVTRKIWELVERIGGSRQADQRPPMRRSA